MGNKNACDSIIKKIGSGLKIYPLSCSWASRWPAALYFVFLSADSWINWLGTKGIFITIFTLFGVIGGANVAYRQIIELTTDPGKTKKPTDRDIDGRD